MTKPSETPRTDAAAFDQVCCEGEYPVKRKYYTEGDYVEADFARKLELELAEAMALAKQRQAERWPMCKHGDLVGRCKECPASPAGEMREPIRQLPEKEE